MAVRNIVIRSGAAMTYNGRGYDPNPVQVIIGDTVIWKNNDSIPHTVTSGEPGQADGMFGGEAGSFGTIIAPKAKQEFTFPKEGEYHYFCGLHPNEVGILEVIAGRGHSKGRKVQRHLEGPIHGHFFFVDIVGLSDPSKGGTESQIEKIKVLHDCISKCKSFRTTSNGKKYVNLTGDGMVIGFLEGPQLPLNLAIELHEKLHKYNAHRHSNDRIQVRIGIDSAPILRYKDIFGKRNVWGEGIVISKRVMDAGKAKDILLTDRAAEGLKQFDEYRNVIDYAGEVMVKHKRSVRVFYAHSKKFGNDKPDLSKQGSESGVSQNVSKQSHTFNPSGIDPDVQIVNFGVEPPRASNADRAEYHPNLVNYSNIPVSNIRIYYQILDRLATLNDVVTLTKAEKPDEIVYEGSILPYQPARVSAVQIPRTSDEISAIFLIEYEFGSNQHSRIAFDVRFKNLKNTSQTAYVNSVLLKAQT